MHMDIILLATFQKKNGAIAKKSITSLVFALCLFFNAKVMETFS